MAITLEEYWMGRDKLYPPSAEIQAAAEALVPKLNLLLEKFGQDRVVTSGYRPPAINATVPNAAKYSNHEIGHACDLADHAGDLDAWCVTHLEVLVEIGLWLESPVTTHGWCHLQDVPPHSGKRVFSP